MSEVLAGLYSRSDAFKRKLVDALRNPGAALDQIRGQMVDDLRSGREQIAAAADEGVNYGPASRALAMKMADAYSPVGMTKVVGPQSEALETARRNAVKMLGLPENNTAMDRAKALGFTEDAYHSTAADFKNFDLSKVGTETVLPVGAPKAVYTAKAPELAERYAKREGQRLMPLIVNPAGAPINNSKIIAIDNPTNIRSRFAAFDPARVNENDLLAGMLPLSALALPKDDKKEGKKNTDPRLVIDELRRKKD